MTLTWGRRLLPLIVTQALAISGILLFAYGPWPWPLRNPERLYTFLIAVQVMLVLGYLSVAHRSPTQDATRPSVTRLLWIGLIVTALILPVTSHARTDRWIPDVLGALADPGQAYREALHETRGINYSALLRVFAAPFLAVLAPLSIFYWKTLPPWMRWASVACMLGVVAISIATGSRRDIGDLLITVPFLLLAGHWSGVSPISRATQLSLAAFGVAAASLFAVYFAVSHISRIGVDLAAYGINPITEALPDPSHPLLEALPAEARPGFMGATNYLTTGYYGLSLALNREFVPMYGVGHSIFLSYVASRLTTRPELEWSSYPARISLEDGFRFPTFWCTAYPYFASDLTFPGTVLLMFLIGRLHALVWIDTLGGKNPSAVILFAMVTILVVYLPATNRMLQDGEAVLSFYGWLFTWWYGRRSLAKEALKPCSA